mmetsp:Transcript_334/g.630  ORF Transcript_334/g.630 Transcript_334/m.630 type:complete len:117 (-) Transcript_334:457-807(-)
MLACSSESNERSLHRHMPLRPAVTNYALSPHSSTASRRTTPLTAYTRRLRLRLALPPVLSVPLLHGLLMLLLLLLMLLMLMVMLLLKLLLPLVPMLLLMLMLVFLALLSPPPPLLL